MTKRILYLSTFKLLNIIVILIAMTSCHHKELCYMHPHSTKIEVVYDWSDAPEASPAGMSAYFYSEDNEAYYRRFDFPGAKGGEIEIAAGNYVLITYNNDTEAVQFSGQDDFGTHRAYTRDGDLLEPMYGNGVTSSLRAEGDERVVITPDALYGCSATDIEITEHGVHYSFSRADADTVQTIVLHPHDLLCHYTFEVRNVKNVKHIRSVSAAISGMSGSMNLSDESLDSEPVTLPLGAKANIADSTITGKFLTFGHSETNNAKHAMTFYVVMDNGDKHSFLPKDNPQLDVTSQVDSAPDRRHVHIIIDGLDLPTPLENDSGFNPSVEDWGAVNETIKI